MNPVLKLCHACRLATKGTKVSQDGLPELAHAALTEYDRVRQELHEAQLEVKRCQWALLYPMTDLS